jgi:hypothetical protein
VPVKLLDWITTGPPLVRMRCPLRASYTYAVEKLKISSGFLSVPSHE